MLKKLLFILFITISFLGISQNQKVTRYFSIGPSLSSYKGDLSKYEKFSSGIELSLIQNKDKNVRGIFNFAAGSVIAQNVDPIYQGLEYKPLSFVQTSYLSASYTLNYFLLKKEHIKAYAGLGFGYFQFNPKDQYGNEVHSVSNNARLESESYQPSGIFLPIQFGGIYTMKNNFGIQANFKWMNTRTDYLDNMSALANSQNKDNIILINIALVIPISESKNNSKRAKDSSSK